LRTGLFQRPAQGLHGGRAVEPAILVRVQAARQRRRRARAANGSWPSASSVGDPRIPHRTASATSVITRRCTVTPGRPASTSASRFSSSGAFGQPGTASTVSFIATPASCAATPEWGG
jgi:hypothetical protein